MNATMTVGGNSADPVHQILLAAEAALPTRADLLFAGQLQIANIRKRTLAGLDVDGTPFVRYSAAYADRKAKKVGKGLVNLFGTAHHTHMMNALQVIVDSDAEFGVGIYANEELAIRARVHNEGATIPTRLSYSAFEAAKYGYEPRNPRRYKQAKATFEMPRRHWLGASDAEVAGIADAIGERLEERLKTVGN
jgi:phage gpG-like protein